MSPMYGENSGSSMVMNEIFINDVRDRDHQIIRSQLLKYMDGNETNSKKKLELDFQVNISRNPLLIETSGEANRMQIDVEVEYGIFRITEFRELIYNDTTRVVNTYTLSESEYNNAQADISTYNLIAKEIASNINRQISLNYLQLVE
jgi:hypothetical protein